MNKKDKKQAKLTKSKTNKQILYKTGRSSFANTKLYLISLLEKWSFSFSIFMTPEVIIPAFIGIIFLYYTNFQEGLTRIILEVLVIIFSSIATSFAVQNWIEAKGNTLLAKKSDASVRYLQSLKYKVKNIADRIKEFHRNDDRDFDEILNLLSNIDKDVLNSISDWTDINPASKKIVDYFIKEEARSEAIKKLKNDIKEISEQKAKLNQAQETEIKKLEKEISEKELKISELKDKISESSLNNLNIASGTFPSGLSPSVSPSVSWQNVDRCKRCGQPLSLLDQYDTDPETQGLCAKCKGHIWWR